MPSDVNDFAVDYFTGQLIDDQPHRLPRPQSFHVRVVDEQHCGKPRRIAHQAN